MKRPAGPALAPRRGAPCRPARGAGAARARRRRACVEPDAERMEPATEERYLSNSVQARHQGVSGRSWLRGRPEPATGQAGVARQDPRAPGRDVGVEEPRRARARPPRRPHHARARPYGRTSTAPNSPASTSTPWPLPAWRCPRRAAPLCGVQPAYHVSDGAGAGGRARRACRRARAGPGRPTPNPGDPS